MATVSRWQQVPANDGTDDLYWWNEETGETSWDAPVGSTAAAPTAPASGGSAVGSRGEASDRQALEVGVEDDTVVEATGSAEGDAAPSVRQASEVGVEDDTAANANKPPAQQHSTMATATTTATTTATATATAAAAAAAAHPDQARETSPPASERPPPPPPPPPPMAVPGDRWSAYVDSTSGDTYYHNQTTGVTSWDRPVAPPGTTSTIFVPPPAPYAPTHAPAHAHGPAYAHMRASTAASAPVPVPASGVENGESIASYLASLHSGPQYSEYSSTANFGRGRLAAGTDSYFDKKNIPNDREGRQMVRQAVHRPRPRSSLARLQLLKTPTRYPSPTMAIQRPCKPRWRRVPRSVKPRADRWRCLAAAHGRNIMPRKRQRYGVWVVGAIFRGCGGGFREGIRRRQSTPMNFTVTNYRPRHAETRGPQSRASRRRRLTSVVGLARGGCRGTWPVAAWPPARPPRHFAAHKAAGGEAKARKRRGPVGADKKRSVLRGGGEGAHGS